MKRWALPVDSYFPIPRIKYLVDIKIIIFQNPSLRLQGFLHQKHSFEWNNKKYIFVNIYSLQVSLLLVLSVDLLDIPSDKGVILKGKLYFIMPPSKHN